jgi:hypothetical protein
LSKTVLMTENRDIRADAKRESADRRLSEHWRANEQAEGMSEISDQSFHAFVVLKLAPASAWCYVRSSRTAWTTRREAPSPDRLG